MSDLLAAAAAALGTPEALVKRSAEARASASGMTVDEILAAWAGGAAIDAPLSSPTEPPATPGDNPPPSAALQEDTLPPSAGETPTGPPAAQGDNPPPPAASQGDNTPPAPGDNTPPAPSRPAPAGKPPVLVGEPDRPMTVMAGIVGLFLAVLLVGLVGPSVATENPGARTSALSYSEAGLQGQKVYENLGCGSCHTQMVRPIVSDVGLGAVSLNDSNQVLGTRRFGPDLSDIGNRLTGTQIEAIVTGLDEHPRAVLSGTDLENLVTYLLQSSTAAPQEEEAPDEAEGEPTGEEAEAGAQP